jgi:hypothetical protein
VRASVELSRLSWDNPSLARGFDQSTRGWRIPARPSGVAGAETITDLARAAGRGAAGRACNCGLSSAETTQAPRPSRLPCQREHATGLDGEPGITGNLLRPHDHGVTASSDSHRRTAVPRPSRRSRPWTASTATPVADHREFGPTPLGRQLARQRPDLGDLSGGKRPRPPRPMPRPLITSHQTLHRKPTPPLRDDLDLGHSSGRQQHHLGTRSLRERPRVPANAFPRAGSKEVETMC